MRLSDAYNTETMVQSVTFSDDTIEMTLTEDREVGEDDMMARILVMRINDEERLQLVLEIQERLIDLVERGYVAIRNPQKKFSIQESRAARLQEEDDELDEEG
jgi:hypothetical protein